MYYAEIYYRNMHNYVNFYIMYSSLIISKQSFSTSFITPTTPTPPTIPPKSRCAKKAKDLSTDESCSGGAKVAEILVNQSALLDTARISRLHSYFCSSQRCFNKYVNTYSVCFVAFSRARGNASGETVRLHTS